jgi:hypothetical protein
MMDMNGKINTREFIFFEMILRINPSLKDVIFTLRKKGNELPAIVSLKLYER